MLTKEQQLEDSTSEEEAATILLDSSQANDMTIAIKKAQGEGWTVVARKQPIGMSTTKDMHEVKDQVAVTKDII